MQFISQEKGLVVIFNSILSFDALINEKVSKTSRALGLIKRTFSLMDVETLEQQNIN